MFGCHNDDPRTSGNVEKILAAESAFGLRRVATYASFQHAVEKLKDGLLQFLLDAKRDGKKVVGYGAAAKGSTLLNFAGVKPDLLPFICDAAPSKQGRFMPGSHIPIHAPDALKTADADFVLILPWNIATEAIEKTRGLVSGKTRYVVAVPELTFL